MTPAKGFTSRRAFMGGVAAVAAWPLAGRAQQAVMPRIGVLVLGHPDPELFLRPFREGLAARGWPIPEDARGPVSQRISRSFAVDADGVVRKR